MEQQQRASGNSSRPWNRTGGVGVPGSTTSDTAIGGLFGMVKGGAGNLMRNIKETSAKVITSVVPKGSLDIRYVTSRLLVMSAPVEGIESVMRNPIDEVLEYITVRYDEQFMVFNLCSVPYNKERLLGKVTDCDWPNKGLPSFDQLVTTCRAIHTFLDRNAKAVVIVHCEDGKSMSATAVAAFFMYTGLFRSPHAGLKLFTRRRFPDGFKGHLVSPSQNRYLRYCFRTFSAEKKIRLCSQHAILRQLCLTSVPKFNLQRTGCTPQVEVFIGGELRWASVSLQDGATFRSFAEEDPVVVVPFDALVVEGDITIIVSHIRSLPSSVGRGMKSVVATTTPMMKVCFNTHFLSDGKAASDESLTFKRSDFDGLERNDTRFDEAFTMILDVSVKPNSEKLNQNAWSNSDVVKKKPLVCFETRDEQEIILSDYSEADRTACQSLEELYVNGTCSLHQADIKNIQLLADFSGGDFSSYIVMPEEMADTNADNTLLDMDNQDNGSTSTSSAKLLDLTGNGPTDLTADSTTVPPGAGYSGDLLSLDTEESSGRVDNPLQQSSVGANANVASMPPASGDLMDIFGGMSSQLPSTSPQPSSSSPSMDLMGDFTDSGMSTGSFIPVDMSTAGVVPPPVLGVFGHAPSMMTNSSQMGVPMKNPSLAQIQQRSHMGGMMAGSPQASGMCNVSSTFASSAFGSLPASSMHSPMGSRGSTARSRSSTIDDPFAHLTNFSGSPAMEDSGRSTPDANTAIPPRKAHSTSVRNLTSGTGVASVGSVDGLDSRVRTGSEPHPFSTGNHTSPTMGTGMGAGTSYTSVIGGRAERGLRTGTNTTGIQTKVEKNAFDDLLSSQGFQAQNSGTNISLKDMQSKELEKTMDPIKLKVMRWTEGKRKNVRALLAALPDVLWEGANWTPVGMHQLVQPNEIKKAYRKACLAVHPDKLSGQPEEALARAIFIELNEAWSAFEQNKDLTKVA